jgi:hypothetical protein
MAFPNTTGMIIAAGYNCQVRTRDKQPIALVASFQANEDFQVQEATVIGNLGPVSLDPQGYTCTITMDGFLPAKGFIPEGEQQYDETGGGRVAITNIFKDATRENIMLQGAVVKIDYLEFYNRKSGQVLASFNGVVLTSYGISVEGNAYARNNVQMRALQMIRAKE